MIYILLLEGDHFYVGYSARPIGDRFLEHFHERGSKWTQKYPPVEVLQIFPHGTIEDEDEVTLQMMELYGWWKVRGGRWCSVDMTSCPLELLKRRGKMLDVQRIMIRRPDPLAFPRLTFFGPKPPRNPSVDRVDPEDERIEKEEDWIDPEISDTDLINLIPKEEDVLTDTISVCSSLPISSSVCLRCGRCNHTEADCVYDTYFDGSPCVDSPVNTMKTPMRYTSLSKGDSAICIDCDYLDPGVEPESPIRTAFLDLPLTPQLEEDIRVHICMRCGRNNHYSDECNHLTYFDGTWIPGSSASDMEESGLLDDTMDLSPF
jgi:predicted GIY-YIG superfamily endonuclease